MKVFYHNDNDGKAAAFWIHLHVGLDASDYNKNRTNFFEINYDKKFPLEIIQRDEPVWIVDFSIQPDEMQELLKITPNVIWIDHHKTAIEKYKDFNQKIYGLRYDGLAGCMLTYIFVDEMTGRGERFKNPDAFNPSMAEKAPYFLKLIADRDVWKFEYGDAAKFFHLATQTLDLSPSSKDWHKIMDSEYEYNLDDLITQGELIEKYRNATAKEYRKQFAYSFDWEGFKCLAMNRSCSSEYFGEDINNYDLVIPHVFNGKKWIVSLYTVKDIDASIIAKKYGGGGHKKACGFTCDKLPWLKYN